MNVRFGLRNASWYVDHMTCTLPRFKMAVKLRSFVFVHFCIFLLGFVQPVAAFDAGDALALILGLLIGIMGICACLGAYARRKEWM